VQRFAELGMTADDMSPEQVDEFIQSEIAKWERVIKEADIRALE
jgi:tripartite-type tricarboxylate transporter receptor subunit TctC